MKKPEKCNFEKTDLALVAGSGFSFEPDGFTQCGSVQYLDLIGPKAGPVFSTSDGGKCYQNSAGRKILVFNKRLHLYQGFSPWECLLPIRTALESNVKALILTNASGGINSKIETGDLVVIREHIFLPSNESLFSDICIEYPDKNETPYDPGLSDLLLKTAETNSRVHSGRYVYVNGPAYETHAEIDFINKLGGDIVGMSTAIEAQYAFMSGMRVVALSLVTNTHEKDRIAKLSHEEVLSESLKAMKKIEFILNQFVGELFKIEL